MNAGAGAARRRTVGFGALAVTAALLTSACAAGRVAQTQNQRPAVSGVSAQVGPIAIRNLTVEAPPQGSSYPVGSTLRLVAVFVNNGSSGDELTDISSPMFTSWGAYSSVTDGDQVVGAAASTSAAGSTAASPAPTDTAPVTGSGTGSGSGTSSASPPGASPTPLPSPTSTAPQASRTVAVPAGERASYGVPDATGSLLALTTKSTIYPGGTVTMTLTFAHAGTVTVRVPVNVTSNPGESSLPAPSGSGGGD